MPAIPLVMVLVKLLGVIDILASILFLGNIFAVPIPVSATIIAAGLLFIKGLFIFIGNFFSLVDLAAAGIILFSLFFAPWIWLMWLMALVLMAKGMASFF